MKEVVGYTTFLKNIQHLVASLYLGVQDPVKHSTSKILWMGFRDFEFLVDLIRPEVYQ